MLPSAACPVGFGSVGEAARDGDFMAAFDVDVGERLILSLSHPEDSIACSNARISFDVP